jgi:hypothetical protein
MRSLALEQTFQTVLDGSGNGIVLFGPSLYGEEWTVTRTGVLTSSAAITTAAIPQVQLYVASRFIDGTYTGSNNTSDTTYQVHSGQQIQVTFLGGQPGDTATVSVSGTRNLP